MRLTYEEIQECLQKEKYQKKKEEKEKNFENKIKMFLRGMGKSLICKDDKYFDQDEYVWMFLHIYEQKEFYSKQFLYLKSNKKVVFTRLEKNIKNTKSKRITPSSEILHPGYIRPPKGGFALNDTNSCY